MKITGMNKSTDVTLKRGVIGSLNLYNWLDQIRNGDQNAMRTVTVHAAERGPHGRRCRRGSCCARASSRTRSGPFNAKGTDVAMEELVLAYERLEME